MLFCCVKTIQEVFNTFKHTLADLYDAQEIEAVTLLTLKELTGLSGATIKAFPEKEITLRQSENIQTAVSRLQIGEPLQYILGYTEFYGLKLLVNPSVLIPRPETEELVEWVLKSAQPQANILDIGTGNGCIGISLKKNLREATISGMDISPEALATARTNAELNQTDVNFIEDDILQSANEKATVPFDIIVSNPPYVTLENKMRMHTNVTNFEPHTALFVPEYDPLIFYDAIADYAINNLTDNGLLFFEINESYGAQTVELLKNKGFTNIELRRDMSERDRMISAQKR
jgi:release factor glutamine methyltransferase